MYNLIQLSNDVRVQIQTQFNLIWESQTAHYQYRKHPVPCKLVYVSINPFKNDKLQAWVKDFTMTATIFFIADMPMSSNLLALCFYIYHQSSQLSFQLWLSEMLSLGWCLKSPEPYLPLAPAPFLAVD